VRRILSAAAHCRDARIYQRYVEKEFFQRAHALYVQFVRGVNTDFRVQWRTASRPSP
jgi:hypothetical protein